MKCYHLIHKPTRRHFYVQAASVASACKLIDCPRNECMITQITPRRVKATQTMGQFISNTPHPSDSAASTLWEGE